MRCLDCGKKLLPPRTQFARRYGVLLARLRRGQVTINGLAKELGISESTSLRWLLKMGARPSWKPTHKRGRPPLVWTLPDAPPVVEDKA